MPLTVITHYFVIPQATERGGRPICALLQYDGYDNTASGLAALYSTSNRRR